MTINLNQLKNKAKKAPEPEPTPEPVVETAEIESVFSDMTAAQIDALVKENEIPVPGNWKVMKLAAKRQWLVENVDLSEEGAEEATEEVAVEEAQEEVAEAEIVAETPKKGKAPAKGTAVGKPAKTGEVMEKSELSEIAQEIESLKENDAKELAVDLVNSADRGFFKLGGVLALIQENKWYAPYASFKEYVETEHSMEYRRALYWTGIYKSLMESGVPYSKVAHLGWTKLKEIAGIITPKNLTEWIKVAEKNNVATLAALVRSHKEKQLTSGSTDNVPDKTQQTVTTKAFKLHPDQLDTVTAALQKSKEDTGTDVDTVALENICTDFLNGGKAPKAKVPPLAKQLKDAGAEAAIEAFNEAFPDLQIGLIEAEEEQAEAA